MQPSSDDKEYLASRAEYLASRAEYLSGDSSAGHAVGGLLMLQPSAPPPHHPMPPQPLHPLMHPAVPVPHGPLPHQLPQAAAYPAPMRVMVAPPHRLPQMGAASTHMHPHMVPHPCAAPPAAWPSKRPVEMIQVRRAASHAPGPSPPGFDLALPGSRWLGGLTSGTLAPRRNAKLPSPSPPPSLRLHLASTPPRSHPARASPSPGP